MIPSIVIQDWGSCTDVDLFIDHVLMQSNLDWQVREIRDQKTSQVSRGVFAERVKNMYEEVYAFLKGHKSDFSNSDAPNLQRLKENIKMVKIFYGTQSKEMEKVYKKVKNLIIFIQKVNTVIKPYAKELLRQESPILSGIVDCNTMSQLFDYLKTSSIKEQELLKKKFCDPEWNLKFENAIYEWIESAQIPIQGKNAQKILEEFYSLNSRFYKGERECPAQELVDMILKGKFENLSNLELHRALRYAVFYCKKDYSPDFVIEKRLLDLQNYVDSIRFADNEFPIGAIKSLLSEMIKYVHDFKISFAAFMLELEQEIFPFYEKHETGFDRERIHGRMHVARAIIFGEVMARYYRNQGQFVDFNYVRRTIGLHDAGRKANGIDWWEKESSELLYNHLILKNTPKEEAVQKSSIIVKENTDKNSIAFIIFQSADCLDIMRPCTGHGGRKGFDPKYLTFLKNSNNSKESQFRESLIKEAWFFIQITEKQKMTEFNESEGFMDKLFQVIKEHETELPILSSILLE